MKVIIFIAGIFLVALAAYFFHPWFTQKKASESLTDIAPAVGPDSSSTKDGDVSPEPVGIATALRTLSTGEFEGITVHQAKGTATLVQSGDEYYVRLEDNFEITNGPDLVVYLGKDGKHDPDALLGELKGNSGGQNYLVPASLDPKNYSEVWVWCRRFSVGFGKAVLQ